MFKQFNLEQPKVDFAKFHEVYIEINASMWREYGVGQITKEQLRIGRFTKTLECLSIPSGIAGSLADYYLERSPYQTNLIPYTHELLSSLKRDQYHLHIITNGFREVQMIKLGNNDLLKYFEVIVCSEDVGKNKPNVLIFNHALKEAGAMAKDSCMIGDDYEVDYLGALRAGMKAIHFNYQGRQKVKREDDIVTSLLEIPGKLPWLFRN